MFLPRYQLQLVRTGFCKFRAPKLDGSHTASKVCTAAVKTILGNSPTEKFLIATLDTQNRVIGIHEISSGTLDASLVHPRLVFTNAYLCNAASIILIHNHPSGELTPSQCDIDITKRLREVGDLFGTPITEHIIVGHNPETDQWHSCSLRERSTW
jgi:DNA repair protein RadC